MYYNLANEQLKDTLLKQKKQLHKEIDLWNLINGNKFYVTYFITVVSQQHYLIGDNAKAALKMVPNQTNKVVDNIAT